MIPRQKSLTPIQHLHALRRFDPMGDGDVRCDSLQWETTIRPTPISRAYRLRIIHRKGKSPQVKVVAPSLKALAENRHIPHLYDQERETLCLYLPGAGEFDSTSAIGPQLIPWAATWLYYFEEWLESGEWKGGGEHPSPPNPKSRKRKFSTKMPTRPTPTASHI